MRCGSATCSSTFEEKQISTALSRTGSERASARSVPIGCTSTDT